MTCIVGIVEESGVWMGGDNFAEMRGVVLPRRLPKIFRLHDENDNCFLLGASGDSRYGHILRYRLQLPLFARDDDPHRYLCCEFADAVRDCLRQAGMLINNSVVEENQSILMVGFQGRLFVMGTDFNISETTRPYRAIGSGEDAAPGSLYTSVRIDGYWANLRLQMALEAASEMVATVKPPFDIEKL